MKKHTLLFLSVFISLISFAQTSGLQKTEQPEEEERQTDSACGGTERWSVKVMTDALASSVNYAPLQSTVAGLLAITTPFPDPYMIRQAGIESNTYQITCNITVKKEETDADCHLVLSDGTHTLIGEIPNAACSTAVSSAHAFQYAAARSFIDAHIAMGNVNNVNIGQVTITGVAFIDPPHGQTGAAPNNIELHPILDIHFASSAAPPIAAFTPSSPPACVGKTIVLTDNSLNSPSSWTWTMTGASPASSNLQSPSITYSTPGTYTVTLVSSNTHGSSTAVSHTITVNPIPAVPTITDNGNVLTSSASSGNQWYASGGAIGGSTAQTYTASANSTYYVSVTNSYGCSSSSAPITISNTGISSIADNDVLNIFPNPANGLVTINFSGLSRHISIEIFNDLGQLIYSEKRNESLKESSKTIDLGAFQAGIYLFKIAGDEKVFIKKIFLQKQ